MTMQNHTDGTGKRRTDVTHEESKRRGVRASDNHVVDSRSSTGLSSSPKSNTSQPSEKYRESSTRSPVNGSASRVKSSQEGRGTNYREERVQHNRPRFQDDSSWRRERHGRRFYDGPRRGNDRYRRDRLESERYGRDVRGPAQAAHFRREQRYSSPPTSSRRSSMENRGRRSYSESSGRSADSRDHSRSRSKPRSRSNHRDARQSRSRSRSYSPSSSSVSSSSVSSNDDEIPAGIDESTFSKDQRTVFVSQLVMRATEKDLRRYFRRKVGCIVREVILLRDKRMRSHKGGAYIEMGRIEDVNKAVAVSGIAPDFQRFPLLVKLSEAEKNYVAPPAAPTTTAWMMGKSSPVERLATRDVRKMAKKVYVGGLDTGVTEEHLFALFSQFGHLEAVDMQRNLGAQSENRVAFLAFSDPKVANLAIHTMADKILAGRPMKTGWVSQESSTSTGEGLTSDEFPEDSEARKQKAFAVLEQLTGAVKSGSPEKQSDDIDSKHVANAEPLISTSAVSDGVGLKGEPGPNILVRNMFDKDSETEDGWAEDLKDEFIQECSKFGKILSVTVISQEAGGKIFASFDSVDSAKLCAQNLSGRWFDKRQLQVEYVGVSQLPDGHLGKE